MSAEDGKVLDSSSVPTTALSGVELFGTEFIFYPAGQFQLDPSTGKTFYVGSKTTRGDTSRAETLMAFNFGTETEMVETGEPLATEVEDGASESGEEDAGEEPDEDGEEEEEEEGVSEEEMTEDVSEGGAPSALQMFNELLDEIPDSNAVGYFVFGVGASDMVLVDATALENLREIADSIDTETRNGATNYQMDLAGMDVMAFESKTQVDAGEAEAPSYQLSVGENEEDVEAEDLVLSMKASNLITQVSTTRPGEEQEEEETLDEALSALAELAAETGDDLVPGGFAMTARGVHVGGDALAILQEVAGDFTQSTLTYMLGGSELVFSVEDAPSKYIGTEENGAFLLEADNAAAEALTARGLVMPMQETGALRMQQISETVTTGGESASEPDPAPEPSGQAAEDDDESAFSKADDRLGSMLDTMEQL
jgi:hypothetical protein